jgi:outer membrane protein
MNNKIIIRSILPGLIVTFCINNFVAGQTNTNSTDSLSLKSVILQVISNYPTVKVAEETVRNADSRIGLAKTGYNPVVDITANISKIDPVSKFTIPSFGTFQFYPDYSYSASLNYQQLVYDFGRTHKSVELENEGKAISEQSLEQVKQKLSLYTVNNFYSLLYLQAAIRIKDEQLATLNEHLNYIEKTKATGSATEYQVLATQVRISTVESQKLDLIASMKAQQAALNSLLGNNQTKTIVLKNDISPEIPVVPSDSLLSYAYRNRDEVLINQKRTSLAELKYGMVKLQTKPFLNFQATGGEKNGYLPDLNKLTPNYVIGFGIKVPILDGMKSKYNLAQARSEVNSLSYESDLTKRNISNEVYESEALLYAAEKKVSQSQLQLKQAMKAYSLAETSFQAGAITNLDLLDANTSVSESSLLLLKARIDYATSIYKIKAALGERIY